MEEFEVLTVQRANWFRRGGESRDQKSSSYYMDLPPSVSPPSYGPPPPPTPPPPLHQSPTAEASLGAFFFELEESLKTLSPYTDQISGRLLNIGRIKMCNLVKLSSACVPACLFICLCVCVFVCVWVYVCMFVCEFLCVSIIVLLWEKNVLNNCSRNNVFFLSFDS